MANNEIRLRLRIDDDGRLRAIDGDLDRLNNSANRASNSIDSFTSSLIKIGSAVGGIYAVNSAIKDSITTAMSFEKSIDKLRAVTGASVSQIESLEQKALDLGKSTKYSATQVSEAMGFLGMAGFKTNDILTATEDTLKLASIGSLELGTSADVLSNIMSGFTLKADQANRVVDVMSATITNANVDVRMLGETMKYTASEANMVGATVEEVSALAGVLGNAGKQGSEAGTALRAMFTRLSSPPTEAQKMLEKLNITTKDGAGNLKNIVEIFGELKSKTDKLGSADKVEALSKLFGVEAAGAGAIILDNYNTELKKLLKTVSEADVLNISDKIYKQMTDNLDNSVKSFGSAIENLQIQATKPILTPLKNQIDDISASITRFVESTDFSKLYSNISSHKDELVGLVELYGAFKVGGWIVNGITALRVATAEATIAQRAFNLAVKANPYILAGSVIYMGYTAISQALDGVSASAKKAREAIEDRKQNRVVEKVEIDMVKSLDYAISQTKKNIEKGIYLHLEDNGSSILANLQTEANKYLTTQEKINYQYALEIEAIEKSGKAQEDKIKDFIELEKRYAKEIEKTQSITSKKDDTPATPKLDEKVIEANQKIIDTISNQWVNATQTEEEQLNIWIANEADRVAKSKLSEKEKYDSYGKLAEIYQSKYSDILNKEVEATKRANDKKIADAKRVYDYQASFYQEYFKEVGDLDSAWNIEQDRFREEAIKKEIDTASEAYKVVLESKKKAFFEANSEMKNSSTNTAKETENIWGNIDLTSPLQKGFEDTFNNILLNGKFTANSLEDMFKGIGNNILGNITNSISKIASNAIFGGGSSGGFNLNNILSGGNLLSSIASGGGLAGSIATGLTGATGVSGIVGGISGGITASLGSSISSLGATFGSSALSSFGAGMSGSAFAGSAGMSAMTSAGGALGAGANAGSMLAGAMPWLGGALALYSVYKLGWSGTSTFETGFRVLEDIEGFLDSEVGSIENYVGRKKKSAFKTKKWGEYSELTSRELTKVQGFIGGLQGLLNNFTDNPLVIDKKLYTSKQFTEEGVKSLFDGLVSMSDNFLDIAGDEAGKLKAYNLYFSRVGKEALSESDKAIAGTIQEHKTEYINNIYKEWEAYAKEAGVTVVEAVSQTLNQITATKRRIETIDLSGIELQTKQLEYQKSDVEDIFSTYDFGIDLTDFLKFDSVELQEWFNEQFEANLGDKERLDILNQLTNSSLDLKESQNALDIANLSVVGTTNSLTEANLRLKYSGDELDKQLELNTLNTQELISLRFDLLNGEATEAQIIQQLIGVYGYSAEGAIALANTLGSMGESAFLSQIPLSDLKFYFDELTLSAGVSDEVLKTLGTTIIDMAVSGASAIEIIATAKKQLVESGVDEANAESIANLAVKTPSVLKTPTYKAPTYEIPNYEIPKIEAPKIVNVGTKEDTKAPQEYNYNVDSILEKLNPTFKSLDEATNQLGLDFSNISDTSILEYEKRLEELKNTTTTNKEEFDRTNLAIEYVNSAIEDNKDKLEAETKAREELIKSINDVRISNMDFIKSLTSNEFYYLGNRGMNREDIMQKGADAGEKSITRGFSNYSNDILAKDESGILTLLSKLNMSQAEIEARFTNENGEFNLLEAKKYIIDASKEGYQIQMEGVNKQKEFLKSYENFGDNFLTESEKLDQALNYFNFDKSSANIEDFTKVVNGSIKNIDIKDMDKFNQNSQIVVNWLNSVKSSLESFSLSLESEIDAMNFDISKVSFTDISEQINNLEFTGEIEDLEKIKSLISDRYNFELQQLQEQKSFILSLKSSYEGLESKYRAVNNINYTQSDLIAQIEKLKNVSDKYFNDEFNSYNTIYDSYISSLDRQIEVYDRTIESIEDLKTHIRDLRLGSLSYFNVSQKSEVAKSNYLDSIGLLKGAISGGNSEDISKYLAEVKASSQTYLGALRESGNIRGYSLEFDKVIGQIGSFTRSIGNMDVKTSEEIQEEQSGYLKQVMEILQSKDSLVVSPLQSIDEYFEKEELDAKKDAIKELERLQGLIDISLNNIESSSSAIAGELGVEGVNSAIVGTANALGRDEDNLKDSNSDIATNTANLSTDLLNIQIGNYNNTYNILKALNTINSSIVGWKSATEATINSLNNQLEAYKTTINAMEVVQNAGGGVTTNNLSLKTVFNTTGKFNRAFGGILGYANGGILEGIAPYIGDDERNDLIPAMYNNNLTMLSAGEAIIPRTSVEANRGLVEALINNRGQKVEKYAKGTILNPTISNSKSNLSNELINKLNELIEENKKIKKELEELKNYSSRGSFFIEKIYKLARDLFTKLVA